MKSSKLLSAADRVQENSDKFSLKIMRNSLSALVLAGTLAFSGAAYAERSFSSIQVDSTALGVSGAAFLMREVKESVERGLRETFSSNLRGADRNAPKLVVRITSVAIRQIPEGGQASGNSTDFMEGEALIVGHNGVVLQRFPMLAALDNITGGWYLPDYTQRRVQAMSYHYAWWLKRQLPDR